MQDKLRIAILGSRGIPNNYGGFEQCAEKISLYFVKKGHDVTVYGTSEHQYKENEWNGIKIKHIFSNERRLAFLNVFIHDYLSLRDATKKDYDIIFELGYAPNALYYYLNNNTRAKIVTNLAGLEWKRSKWNTVAKRVIKYSEKLAVKKSDALVADNPGISDYILEEYGRKSFYIPYGAELFHNPKEEYLEEYNLSKHNYYMIVARFQPDNNIEMILDGYLLSKAIEPVMVIGDCTNKYGRFLKGKYKRHLNIRFVGGIYNYEKLSSLRWYSRLYFHGHSCGGTNPSLLEAMASNAYIVAHDNPFNRHVLEENGFYFSNPKDISYIINNYDERLRTKFNEKNREKILDIYSWEKVSEEYLRVFEKVLES